MTEVSIPRDELDPVTIEYLKAVEKRPQEEYPGILIRRPLADSSGVRAGRWGFLLFGILLLGICSYLTTGVAPEAAGNKALPIAQAILFAGGMLCVLTSISRFLRKEPAWLPKSFLFADARHLWDVSPSTITATPLDELYDIDGTHHFSNGFHMKTIVELKFPGRVRDFNIFDRKDAERLLQFLQYQLLFRKSDDPAVRAIPAAVPQRFGAMLMRFVESGASAELSNLPEVVDPPVPQKVERDPSAPSSGVVGMLGRFAIAGAVLAAGFYGFPMYNTMVQDDHAWAGLKSDSLKNRAPGPLRQYLAHPEYSRHRGEAQAMIGQYYDKAIADLRAKLAKEPEKVDKDLFEGVLAMLEGLKSADRPVVTVGFTSKIDPKPTEKLAQLREELAVEDGLPMIEPGDAFGAGQVKRREGIILNRLRDAIKKGINADILTLEPAKDGETPMMEVSYHVFAGGKLGVYTNEKKKRVGLLRWYETDWTITLRPPGSEKPHVFKMHAEPGSNLTYVPSVGDPSWAQYAVVLYSGFYEMSARLIRNFGLDPGEVPTVFDFDAVTRDKKELKDDDEKEDDPLERFRRR